MKLTSIDRTATTSWAPVQYPHNQTLCPLIVTGSISGAFDSSFSSQTDLEIFALDMTNASSPDAVMNLGKTTSPTRFNALTWSSAGVGQDKPYGIIAGGKEDGSLDLYNPNNLINNNASAGDALFLHKQVHTGQLSALDFNPFQQNLLATGATQGEIFIWDLNNPEKPYTPGTKSPRLEDLTSLAWNRQVQHILGSASSNGYAVIWDLKNRREILHLTSPTRKRLTAIAWNPEVATQLLTASDDDNVPAIYMWDLRNAHSPEKVLTGHSKGVMSLSWSDKDSELLLSSGKDNRTLCWNPKTAEIVGEFPTSSNWVFDVQWCPKNPDLLSTASFDGKVSFYTIQAKSSPEDGAAAAANDPFSAQTDKPFTLKQPPKWLRCPVGASFGFGNRLITFSSSKDDGKVSNMVKIHQVVTDTELVSSSKKLETTLNENKLNVVCEEHVSMASQDAFESGVWRFMEFINEEDARQKIVQYLGFDKEKLAEKLQSLKIGAPVDGTSGAKSPKKSGKKENASKLADGIVKDVVNTAVASAEGIEGADLFPQSPASDATWGMVELDNKAAGSKVLGSPKSDPFEFYSGGDQKSTDAEITKCIIAGDFNSAVEICLKNDRLDDALILAVHGGQDLLERTQNEFYRRKKSKTSYLRISACLAANNIKEIVTNANVTDCWKEALALICTFAQTDELSELASTLADRLRDESDIVKDHSKKTTLQNAAVLAYMVAGRLDKLVGIWIDQFQHDLIPVEQKLKEKSIFPLFTPEYSRALSLLIEKITIYRKIVPDEPKDDPVYQAQMKALSNEYLKYAQLLASQGQLQAALKYLNTADSYRSLKPSTDNIVSPASTSFFDELSLYKYRIFSALSNEEMAQIKEKPKVPFAAAAAATTTKPAESASPSKRPDPAKISTQSQGSIPKYEVQQTASPARQNPGGSGYLPPSYSTPHINNTQGGFPPQPNYSNSMTFNPPQQNQYGYPQNVGNTYNQYNQPLNSSTAYGVQQPGGFAGQYQPNQYNPPAQPGLVQQPPTGFNPMVPQPPTSMAYGGNTVTSPPPTSNTPSAVLNKSNSSKDWNDPKLDMIKTKKKPVAPAPIPAPFNQPQQPTGYGPPPTGSAPPPANMPGPMSRQPSNPATFSPQQQPMHGAYSGAPPSGMLPQQAQSMKSPEAMKSPVFQGHPVGDRSHIPAEHRPIYEVLSKLLNACKPNAGPPQRKALDDAEKRLNTLFDKLNNEKVGEGAIGILLEMIKAIETRDWQNALGMQQTLLTNYGSTEGTNWILGIKRLLESARQLIQ